MLNKHKRWFHSVTCEVSLVSVSASWFLVSMYLISILGSKEILSNNQSRANSVGSGNMSQFRASSLKNRLDHCFVVVNTYSKASWWEELTFEGRKSTLSQIIDHSMRLPLVFELCDVLNELHVGSDTGLAVLSLIRVSKNCDEHGQHYSKHWTFLEIAGLARELASRQTTGFPVLSWFWVVFPRTKTIRSHKSSAGETIQP